MLVKTGVVEPLAAWASSGSELLAWSAALAHAALALAAEDDDNGILAAMREAGVARVLVTLVRIGSDETRFQAAVALRRWVDLGCDEIGMVTAGVVPALFALARDGPSSCQECA